LKKFCTPFPKELLNPEDQEKHFPLRFLSSDYVQALPTVRNPLARIVTIKIKVASLNFDEHAKDKLLRLVGERYNPETDELTIVTDRCPLRKQNYDYAIYLLTGNLHISFDFLVITKILFIVALYHESQTVEDWESSKSLADMEYYDFNQQRSKESSTNILNWTPQGVKQENQVQPPTEFAKSVEQLINEGENDYNLGKYKEQVVKLLGLVR
jgi:small subunit ribosomal protein S35